MKSVSHRTEDAATRRRHSVRAAIAIVLAVLVGFVGLLGYRIWSDAPDEEDRRRLMQHHPLLPPGVEVRPTPKAVIGDLGGLPVTFPPGFVNNVEYDGDPGFGEKRVGPRPERTYRSGLRSLGFDVRYPEFAVMPLKEMRADQRRYTIFNTPWLGITISASSDLGDGQFLERMTAHMNRDADFQYAKLPKKFHDMDAYTPTTVDVTRRNRDANGVYKNDMRDRDIFVHYDKDGKVDTFIRCNNVNHDAAPCDHHFFLGPGIRTDITVHYRRGMLEHWREIQQSIKDLIFSFKAS